MWQADVYRRHASNQHEMEAHIKAHLQHALQAAHRGEFLCLPLPHEVRLVHNNHAVSCELSLDRVLNELIQRRANPFNS